MADSATTSSCLGNPQHEGALFTFPREVRDEIYRHLIKNEYVIYIIQSKDDTAAPEKDEYGLAILQVSKIISHEASEILYSERLFCLSVDFSVHGIFVLLAQVTDRMKNVRFDFRGLSTWHSQLFPPKGFPTYQDHIETICNAVIAGFTGAEITRNYLRIKHLSCVPGIMRAMSFHILERLKSLI